MDAGTDPQTSSDYDLEADLYRDATAFPPAKHLDFDKFYDRNRPGHTISDLAILADNLRRFRSHMPCKKLPVLKPRQYRLQWRQSFTENDPAKWNLASSAKFLLSRRMRPLLWLVGGGDIDNKHLCTDRKKIAGKKISVASGSGYELGFPSRASGGHLELVADIAGELTATLTRLMNATRGSTEDYFGLPAAAINCGIAGTSLEDWGDASANSDCTAHLEFLRGQLESNNFEDPLVLNVGQELNFCLDEAAMMSTYDTDNDEEVSGFKFLPAFLRCDNRISTQRKKFAGRQIDEVVRELGHEKARQIIPEQEWSRFRAYVSRHIQAILEKLGIASAALADTTSKGDSLSRPLIYIYSPYERQFSNAIFFRESRQDEMDKTTLVLEKEFLMGARDALETIFKEGKEQIMSNSRSQESVISNEAHQFASWFDDDTASSGTVMLKNFKILLRRQELEKPKGEYYREYHYSMYGISGFGSTFMSSTASLIFQELFEELPNDEMFKLDTPIDLGALSWWEVEDAVARAG